MSASDNPVSLATEVVIAAVSPFDRKTDAPARFGRVAHASECINLAALILARAAHRLNLISELERAIAYLGGRS